MSTERTFGQWDAPPPYKDVPGDLWNWLAAQNVGKSDFQPNSGLSQRRHEITMLWHLYQRARPKIVVEIGVAQGGTFASWCFMGEPDALVIGIDRCVNDCRPRAGEQVSPRIVHRTINQMTDGGGGMYALGRNNQRIIPINGWSADTHVLDTLEKTLAGRKIDWLSHDASHSAELFAKDFSIYWPMVADGGVFCAHDIQESKVPDCDKSVEWERIKREEDYSAMYEFKSGRGEDSMGWGVLIR